MVNTWRFLYITAYNKGTIFYYNPKQWSKRRVFLVLFLPAVRVQTSLPGQNDVAVLRPFQKITI